MHRLLRAIGFSDILTYEQEKMILEKTLDERHRTDFISLDDGNVLEEYRLQVAPSMGIALVGVRDKDGIFHKEYYFPYMRAYDGTETVEASVERHAQQETYAGVLEDYQAGITLIFYVMNSVQLRQLSRMGTPVHANRAYLTGLSTEGTILLPVEKSQIAEAEHTLRERKEQQRLYEAARQGDQEAIETLTETERHMMDEIMARIATEDLYTLVESTFMPTGVECDMYAVIGEIQAIKVKSNVYTHEKVVDLKLDCNGCIFHVCINEADLQGVPAIGRRFKGKIWMQGVLEVVEEEG